MQMEQLRKDMMAAMKARDKERKDAISSLVPLLLFLHFKKFCHTDSFFYLVFKNAISWLTASLLPNSLS